MSLIIREARPDDAEQLLAYVEGLTAEPNIDVPLAPGEFNLTIEEERKILADYAASDNSVFLVAEVNGQIVGALNCKGGTRQALRHAATLGISVRNGWRNQGIGHALMARMIEWAQSTGVVKRVELLVYARNTAAIHLYEKFGFEVEGKRRRAVYQNGEYLDGFMLARVWV
jgi:RimJ/RimL family protein N-acetyltransferase